EIVYQHEVLVHHADAETKGMSGIGDVLEPAVDENLAAVGGIKAVQDRHQCRFAGAIFADDAVDGAAAHGQIDIAVGPHRPKPLVDLPEFDGKVRSSAPGGALRMTWIRVVCAHERSRPLTGTDCQWCSRAP